jgi:hypothetical protein
MARRRRRSGFSLSLPIALLAIAVVAAGAWVYLRQRPPVATTADAAATSQVLSADRIDPANEGREISVEGSIRVLEPARDPQFGISADAVVLRRKVEMLQWREKCAASACDYALEWSGKPVDSHTFRDQAGHANTVPFPFASEDFHSAEVRLGAFRVDAGKALREADPGVAFPVHTTQLPPNLAASFRDRDGMLYAGADADHPAAGDLRVSYRIVAAGKVLIAGIQQGEYLKPRPSH